MVRQIETPIIENTVDFDLGLEAEEPEETFGDPDLTDPIGWYFRAVRPCIILDKKSQLLIAKVKCEAQDKLHYFCAIPEETVSLPEALPYTLEIYDSACHALYESGARWVTTLAKTPRSQNSNYRDRTGAGNVGLGRAVVSYNYRKENALTTQSTSWVKRDIFRDGNTLARSVHIKEGLAVKIPKIEAVIDDLRVKLEREPDWQERSQIVLEKLGIQPEIYQAICQALIKPISLHQVIYEGGNLLVEEVVAHPGLTTTEEAEQGLLQQQVEEILKYLHPVARRVIELRYGLGNDGKSMGIKEIGELLGVTHQRVSAIEKTALEMLKAPAKARSLDEYLD